MILKNEKNRSKQSIERSILFGLFFLITSFTFFSLFSTSEKITSTSSQSIYCDAEQVEGENFISGRHQFGNANTRSKEQARSGQYSSKLVPKQTPQYGFSYVLRQFQPGESFIASVWRYQPQLSAGTLVVMWGEQSKFYKQEQQFTLREKNGWEKLEIRFTIPFKAPPDSISIHVFNNSANEVFFDDLEIKSLGHWTSEQYKPKVVKLKIPEKGMKKLQEKRQQAFQAGILESEEKDWAKAELLDTTGSIPIKIRLKGDWLDHLQGDKWSFRVKVKSTYSWNRFQSFSLHTPAARYFLHEWLLHQLWRKEGVLSPRYEFVELQINGKSLGIYALEEHFEKQLLESDGRREGPILKFSEDGFWATNKRQLNEYGFIRYGTEHSGAKFENAPIEGFQQNRTLRDSNLSRQFQAGQELLWHFRNGTKKASVLFDLEKLARYYAISDLFNAYHGIIWHNQRFYYNPVINKLEPIGFDGFGGPPEEQFSFLGAGALNIQKLTSNSIFSFLFQEEEFVRLYLQNLYQFTKKEYLINFWNEIYPQWQAMLTYLQLEFPEYQPTFRDILNDASYIHSLLLPYQEGSLQAHTQWKNEKEKQVQINNVHNLPIEIIGLDSTIVLPSKPSRILQSRLKKKGKIVDYNAIRFLEQGALKSQSTLQNERRLLVPKNTKQIFFKVLGIDSVFSTIISPFPSPQVKRKKIVNSGKKPLANSTAYYQKGRLVHFNTGQHLIKQNLIIPANHKVLIEAGTKLNLVNGASIISYSPIHFVGTAASPVHIYSSDKTGSIAVFQTKEKSVLKHVVFERLNTLQKENWNLTGAVSFYEADVDLYHCAFKNNYCEDALNIIRSNFTIQQCKFTDIYFDAIDIDFSKGEIKKTSCQKVGNDGFDFSGSVVNIYDCAIAKCADKGISVGEESDVTVFSTQVQEAPIAFASKDLSLLYLKDVQVTNCDQVFVAFQKKPEYGGAKIIVESYEAEQIRRLHQISEGSFLQLEDRVIR